MTITVNTPDGGTAQFPDGTPPDRMQAVLAQKFGAPSPQDKATAAGQALGAQPGAWGTVAAAAGQAERQTTFGLSDYLNAGVRYAAQRAIGVPNADSYNTDLAYVRGESSGEVEGHPVAATAGGVLGGTLGVGKLAEAAKIVPGVGRVFQALAPTKGAPIANVLKAATANAAIGGGVSAAEGQDPGQVAQNAAISAVGGTAAQHAVGFSLNALKPAAARAFQVMADKIHEDVPTLEAAYDTFAKLTGAPPSMAQLMGLKSQGQLRSLAAQNETIGEAAATAANMGSQPYHEQLAQARSATRPQTESDMRSARDSQMDAAMQSTDPRTGVKIADTQVPINGNQKAYAVFTDPVVTYALNNNLRKTFAGSQFNADSLIDKITNDNLNVQDVDSIRKALRNQQDVFSSDSAGTNRDAAIAKQFGDAANAVEKIGAGAHPVYGQALDQYRDASRYSAAFAHAQGGGTVNDLPAGDTRLAAALKTPAGMAGYAHGQALAKGQAALDAIAPAVVKPQQAIGAPNAAQAAMAVATHNPVVQAWHGMKAILGNGLPDQVQQKIAQQLYAKDPATVRQGILNLGRARVSDDQMRGIARVVGGVAAAHISDYLANRGASQ